MRKRPFFHFQQLGYRQNPFGALTAVEWAQVAVLPPAVTTAVLDASAHLQVMGPMGIGKSTTLRKAVAMLAERETAVYEYVPQGQSHFVTQAAPGSVFALDEAQRLTLVELARLRTLAAAQNVRLLLGSHADLSELLAVSPQTWHTIHLPALVDAAHVRRLLTARLAAFALPERPRVTLATAVPDYLFARFGQDLREMEYFLYDVWQSLPTVREVDVAYLEALVG